MMTGYSAAPRNFHLTRIERWESDLCPVCGKLMEGEVYIDGDTVTGLELPSCADTELIIGSCPHCRVGVFCAALYVVPDAPEGRSFFNDNCWEAESPQLFHVDSTVGAWTLRRAENVREVMFAHDKNCNDVLLGETARLDIYFSKPFIAFGWQHAFGTAGEKIRGILSAALEIRGVAVEANNRD